MGLKFCFERDVTGQVIADCYARIGGVLWSKEKVLFDVLFYVSKAAREAGKLPVHTEGKIILSNDPEYSLFDLEALDALGNNPIKSAYEYLKTLPLFANAESD